MFCAMSPGYSFGRNRSKIPVSRCEYFPGVQRWCFRVAAWCGSPPFSFPPTLEEYIMAILFVQSCYPCCEGIDSSNKKISERYKMPLCQENAEDIPVYISEEFFDWFLSGIVPFFLCWSCIFSLNPEKIFIDRSRFMISENSILFILNIFIDAFLRSKGFWKASRRWVSIDGLLFCWRASTKDWK